MSESAATFQAGLSFGLLSRRSSRQKRPDIRLSRYHRHYQTQQQQQPTLALTTIGSSESSSPLNHDQIDLYYNEFEHDINSMNAIQAIKRFQELLEMTKMTMLGVGSRERLLSALGKVNIKI